MATKYNKNSKTTIDIRYIEKYIEKNPLNMIKYCYAKLNIYEMSLNEI